MRHAPIPPERAAVIRGNTRSVQLFLPKSRPRRAGLLVTDCQSEIVDLSGSEGSLLDENCRRKSNHRYKSEDNDHGAVAGRRRVRRIAALLLFGSRSEKPLRAPFAARNRLKKTCPNNIITPMTIPKYDAVDRAPNCLLKGPQGLSAFRPSCAETRRNISHGRNGSHGFSITEIQ